MKKTSIFLLIFIFIQIKVFSQEKINTALTVAKKGLKGLYVAELPNGTKLKTYDLFVDSKEITGIIPLTKVEMSNLYDVNDVQTGLIFKLKENVKLLTLKQLLDRLKVNSEFKTYEVLFDDIELENQDDLLISENIKIVKAIAYTNQRYLNILTNAYDKIHRDRKSVEAQRIKNLELYKQEHPKQ